MIPLCMGSSNEGGKVGEFDGVGDENNGPEGSWCSVFILCVWLFLEK